MHASIHSYVPVVVLVVFRNRWTMNAMTGCAEISVISPLDNKY